MNASAMPTPLGDHPGGLVDLGPVQGQVRGLAARPGPCRGLARGRVLGVEQQLGRGIGEDQRITQPGTAQRAGPLPVQAHHPGPDRAYLQRERGAGNNGSVSTAMASSFLNAAGTMGG